jgi:type III secretion system low calcium response chaperone LcrH/SycD
MNMEEGLKDFFLSLAVKKKLRDKHIVSEALIKGETIQDIVEFSEETMAKFYGAAYRLFQDKRYQEASDAFLFLATLNPHHYDYWLGLGMATQLCHDYEGAIDAYELAAIADIANPIPYFYLAKCLFAIHDRESALQALELAIETANDIEEYDELKRQALLAKEILLEHDK